jgi:hypothetical protein
MKAVFLSIVIDIAAMILIVATVAGIGLAMMP